MEEIQNRLKLEQQRGPGAMISSATYCEHVQYLLDIIETCWQGRVEDEKERLKNG